MRICLFIKDPDLALLCRQVLESTAASVQFLHGMLEDRPAADVFLVEFSPGLELSDIFDVEELRRVVLLVGRDEIHSVRGGLLHLPVTMVFKPLNPSSLQSAVAGVASGNDHRSAGDVLRAERDEMFQYLLSASYRLQEYDRDRANFMERAAHELRAPLTSINGYCGLLLDGQLGPLGSEQREVIERMRASASRASRLTSAIYQLSRGYGDAEQPMLEKTDILACIETAIEEVASLCQERRIEVDARLSPPTSSLYCERQHIEHALANLLDNSCKFAPRGGFIRVRSYDYLWERRTAARLGSDYPTERRRANSRKPNAFRIDITDNGPGIPTDRLETLFEGYASYTNAGDRASSGLGLAVCNLIATRHGGCVWAESNDDGTRFSLVLPSGAHGSTGFSAGQSAQHQSWSEE